MESASASESGETEMTSLDARVTALEATVAVLNLAHDEVEKRVDDVRQFSDNIVEMQERKLAEIEENAKEQRKLLGEMRVHLQNLQNSRVNHKDVLIRHENQTKKLVELVNDIGKKQHDFEMEKEWDAEAKAARFSTFEGKERRVTGDELYDFYERKHSGGRGGGGHGQARHHHHRRVQSVPVERERRNSSSRRLSSS